MRLQWAAFTTEAGRFTLLYHLYMRLPTGTLNVYSRPISTKAHTIWLRNSFSWHAIADIICCLRQQNLIFHYFHNLPLSQKLDPRLLSIFFVFFSDKTCSTELNVSGKHDDNTRDVSLHVHFVLLWQELNVSGKNDDNTGDVSLHVIITKVYIARNNMHVELIRFRKI